MEKPTVEQVCVWMTTHDEGLQFIQFITTEKNDLIKDMAKADDIGLRKIAGAAGVLQGWLDQFEEHRPRTDED